MKKGILTLLLVVTLVANSIMIKAEDNLFNDLQNNHWAIPNIQKLVDMGVINGFPDGSFKPNFSVNVDAFIKMTVTAMGYTSIQNGSPYWAQPFIDKAMELGIIQENQFASYTQAITREEMSSIIAKAIKDEDKADTRNLVENYVNDFSSISYTYVEDVKDAYAFGIITGMPDNTFRPQDESTRAQASTIIHRMIDEKERKPFEPTESPTDDNGQGGNDSGDGGNDGSGSGEEPTPIEHIHKIENGKVVYSTEKIMEILKGYPIIENMYYDTFEENNMKFTDQESERQKYSTLAIETKEFVETLFSRNYKTLDKEKELETLLWWFQGWWGYKNERHAPKDFVNLWLDETEKWKIQQEMILVTDSYRMVYGTDNGKAVRSRIYFKYDNHENHENIKYEFELLEKMYSQVENLQMGKWYYVDVDVEMCNPVSNAPVNWSTYTYTLYTYTYLSDFKLVEGQ
ncbi:S-layer homology domain-containing protein (plasmid) [Vallitalea pronyensis]|uniref:S-layer homology domain-containing protein n=1 Tax=Vallitalea pronyensis TaxID=1348613 RepID=A0A8J8MQB9_9FIRM|nr:S-layer homology domain-containing protein [Vallitalea pronyensis]QUI25920.1 S-layer homology domain-containing protein [Vallitalea pronyensis]